MSFNIIGTGSACPKTIVTNNDLAKFVDTSDEWITSRTGIKDEFVQMKISMIWQLLLQKRP